MIESAAKWEIRSVIHFLTARNMSATGIHRQVSTAQLYGSTEEHCKKRRGMLSKGILLLHDNARPHTSRTIRELLKSFDWEVLDHAPYSSYFAPSDFLLFRYLKHSLGGKRFSDNEEVKAAVNSWLSDQAADLFEKGF
ncbi:histone-lysine N-methyltransferase SETMAR [Trichonephila clavipes]|nr:histone-lysine N-methyltransferase SETMAR [Trichonephila clavipes]